MHAREPTARIVTCPSFNFQFSSHCLEHSDTVALDATSEHKVQQRSQGTASNSRGAQPSSQCGWAPFPSMSPDATGLQGLSAGIQWALVGSWWPVPAQLPNFPAPNSPRRAVQGAKRPGGHFFAGPKTPEAATTTKRALGQWRFAVGNRSGAVRCLHMLSPTASRWMVIVDAGHRGGEHRLGYSGAKSKKVPLLLLWALHPGRRNGPNCNLNYN